MKVAIDIETTGLNPLNSNMLEFAMIWSKNHKLYGIRVINTTKEIYGNINALVMNTKLLAEINGYDNIRIKVLPDKIINNVTIKQYTISHWRNLIECLQDCNAPIENLTIIGKNFQFDDKFIKHYCPNILKYNYGFIDIGNLMLQNDDTKIPGLKECINRAGIKYNENLYHTAAYDALICYKIYEYWTSNERKIIEGNC